ncbi:3-keto-disaccharide hydrolase [Agromyces albus]|uniref:DUF1080 domain-containing protein n=1 Tax=Agromyces albus TaxID=205332 RepID=A0A4Q2L198_9MICO|nr:DUF1080 domain-containing protein [Agromyces albus]RXZ71825.1 DUF1080 domain-containing protein [Agromyces albus]
MGEEWKSLFDGETLDGWCATPRTYGTVWPGGPRVVDVIDAIPDDYNDRAVEYPAVWTVEGGAIVGRQDAENPGWGGYLVSEEDFGDFELELEFRADWPADTGVMIRRLPESWEGLQVLVDHRKSGSIGGFFGNGIGSFHGVPFVIDVDRDIDGTPVGLIEEDPATTLEELLPEKRAMLHRAGSAEEFLAAWRWDDWNHLRIRCVGARPLVTTWVNDVFVAEADAATFEYPNYDPDTVWKLLGERGRIALEVHDNDAVFGDSRWAPGAACRWRNIRIRELDTP